MLQFTIKQARGYAGFTQAEMAQFLHIHRSTYARIEKDASHATAGQICAISQATGIGVTSIFLDCNSTLVE